MILITGGAGYIGSHTVLNLIEKTDYKIIIFDNLENGHIETINTLLEINPDKIIFAKGDLRNIEDIENVFNKYSIVGVIHFAAFALVEESVQNPSKYYRNNIYGTLNLLDTMIKHNVKRIVFSSTCATYGEPTYTPIDEKHPQNPINPYGYSKLAVERIMDDYDKAYKLKSIRLRYFNVAGADEKGRIGEWHEPETHLIPNILKSNNDKVFTIFGDDYQTRDGTCIRDYVNVLDLAEAHRLSYEYLIKENKTDVFNIGTGEGYSVKEVFEACERVLNKKIPVEIKGRRAGDPAVLYAYIGKVKNVLGWGVRPQSEAKKILEESIKSTYLWHINSINKK
ncbi:UDP-glucose 4-epimerase GalE [Brachyspira aalborgi]|uniref:UDP-glucose 4-epimerase n=1 Tax=Brachyspira aalborgi TaxID=29522 RepID=A0A5C8FVB8_9SPIR|nr:UDP-glucose 4-epimerase GalE [Brachyspira aalborgi]TXJ53564.1 UDP-glucose 4-epimerase GalE [Brachyspira aalborgi]